MVPLLGQEAGVMGVTDSKKGPDNTQLASRGKLRLILEWEH